MPNISILLASATQTQELESSSEITRKRGNETLVLKSFVLGLINQFLKQDFGLVGGEALRAVLHLAILEVRLSYYLNFDKESLADTWKIVVLGNGGKYLGAYEGD
jgi:hypothetical protein